MNEKKEEKKRGGESSDVVVVVCLFVEVGVRRPFSQPLLSLSPSLSLSLSLLSSPLLSHQLDHATVGPPGLAVDGHGGHALDPVLDRVGDVGDNLRKWGREFVEKREG